MGSPYGIADSSKWLVRYVHPSTRRRAPVQALPRAWHAEEHDPSEAATVVFLGDLMASAREGPVDVSPSLRHRIAAADLVVLNCESLVGERPFIGLLVFIMSQAYLERVLEALSIDPANAVASVANNHIQDRAASGCDELAGRLDGLGFTLIGLRGAERNPIVTVERRGLRLGFAAWTEWMNRDRNPVGCAVWRPESIDQAILPSRSSAEHDAVIGCVHWDYEFCHFPTAATVGRAHMLLDRSFSLLVGHHPHVLQPIEGRGNGFCQYSLGNLTPMPARVIHWATAVGGLLEVQFATHGPERGRITAYELTPFFQWRKGKQLTLRDVSDLPKPLRRRVSARVNLLFPPEASGRA